MPHGSDDDDEHPSKMIKTNVFVSVKNVLIPSP